MSSNTFLAHRGALPLMFQHRTFGATTANFEDAQNYQDAQNAQQKAESTKDSEEKKEKSRAEQTEEERAERKEVGNDDERGVKSATKSRTALRGSFCPSGELVCVHLQGKEEDYLKIYRLPAIAGTSGDNCDHGTAGLLPY